MNIVVLDGYGLNPGDLSWERLHKLGNAKIYDRTSKEEIIDRIGDAEIVLTNKTPISAETMDKTNIKYIGVLATGYNVVDIEAAKERGIIVTNVPAYSTASVAQMVFAHILEICHHVAHHDKSVKEGKWQNCPDFCYWEKPLIELDGKVMGIIGYGRIGQAVSKVAQAFGMKVLAYSPRRKKELENENMRYVELDELFAQSDIISLHAPLFESTRNIINKESISKMKKSVIIINTSRGPLVNEQDLADALNSGRIYAAGVDVVSEEPIKADNPLLNAKNIFITPHIAWAPKEARVRLMNIAMENIEAYIKGNPMNVVSK
ncbi:MAG: D-2-hydroxyacid dehydrogenase [Clostridiales bacterium]|uniref:D-2-hydroxyacid dehydrogenase n=1 Tax=Clostridium sp. N3C TaxID=1776758 RepID=UPI00092E1B40|nr:D-2-hydroxyacid dehydrogenase [Clostridium sp. N3C]NLZ49179.1 D-2-hydroxyacid dehydrogenase [Clostridiales bacterium]SCN25124.1 Glycerate dehydrogenase [Clostridium sp. N3C]